MTKQNLKLNSRKETMLLYFKLIEFIDGLPKDNVSRRLGDQLLRSGTSILGNYAEGQAEAAKEISQTTLILH